MQAPANLYYIKYYHMNSSLFDDSQKYFEVYTKSNELNNEIKILYFEKFRSIFESLETYRYLHCYIIYIEALLELDEYVDVDIKLDNAILQALELKENQQFSTVYPILLFHKAQVKFLMGQNQTAIKIIEELLKLKKPDNDTKDLIFHIIANPPPVYLSKFHNISVVLLLSVALLLGFQLFELQDNHKLLKNILHNTIGITFILGLIFAFAADLFHYSICKIRTRLILKNHELKTIK